MIEETKRLRRELYRLQVAMAQTEAMWRTERENSRMWKKLYTNSKHSKPTSCADCHWLKRWTCIIACPSIEKDIAAADK